MTDKARAVARFSELPSSAYTRQLAEPFPDPKWAHFNEPLARELGISLKQNDDALSILSGQSPFMECEPLAMAYSGHQFGVFNPGLGDGRGLLYGEFVDTQNRPWELHLKGAGRTPYSRHGDGRAVLRSSIREYLASEHMAALGVPTTRALSLVTSSAIQVHRETIEPAAMVARLASTHVRFGHFEHYFYRQDLDGLTSLKNWVLKHHFPSLYERKNSTEALAGFLTIQVQRTANLVADWQAVGFCHGVMNTDNMSISGETFDYGPYGFMDAYQPDWICNHSDHNGRYAFNQQPKIAYWNLACLAQTFAHWLPVELLQSLIDEFPKAFEIAYLNRMRSKLGLLTKHPEDDRLVQSLLTLMAQNQSDYSLTFRSLLSVEAEYHLELKDYFSDQVALADWVARYKSRLLLDQSTVEERQALMRQSNPAYVLRTYMAQQAIESAEQGDMTEFNRLLNAMIFPYDDRVACGDYQRSPPDWGRGLSLSCSS